MNTQKIIEAGRVKISNDLPFVLIAGPCQLESYDHAMEMAEALTYIAEELNVPFIFKSSFDKANRSSVSAKRGVGLANALPIFENIKKNFNCPIITDIHNEQQCEILGDAVDIIQIPAFLCRQTDLLQAAAKTNKIVNVKKGQFLAPWDTKNILEKVSSFGNDNIMITERGASFGYNNLVSDMRSLVIMKEYNYPVVYDATHSVQQPGGLGSASGGQRDFVPYLARAAASIGIGAIFIETHQDPDNAPSDGPCMVHLKDMPKLVADLKAVDSLVKSL